MAADSETENIEAFELVSEALENIDAYQQTKNESLLVSAHDLLTQAEKLDSANFKTKYFLAVVAYLLGKKDEGADAAAQFEQLMETVTGSAATPSPDDQLKPATDDVLKREMNYNRGAALFQKSDYLQAIDLFQAASTEAVENTEVTLLAYAACALALAKRANSGYSENATVDIARAREIDERIRPRVQPSWIVRLLKLGTPADAQLARRVVKILDEARRIVDHIPKNTEPPQEKIKALG